MCRNLRTQTCIKNREKIFHGPGYNWLIVFPYLRGIAVETDVFSTLPCKKNVDFLTLVILQMQIEHLK